MQNIEQINYRIALQRLINSDFNSMSTATEVIKGIDLSGKIAIVTCGNKGIGLEPPKL